MVKRIRKKFVPKKIKGRKISSHNKYLKNPNINRLNIDSHFIYDIDEGENFYNKIQNKNLLKVNLKELHSLEEKIDSIILDKDMEKKTEYIKIPLYAINKVSNYVTRKEIDNPLTQFLKNKFLENKNREELSSRKLTKEYFDKTGFKTNRTTVNKIIREKLGYRYLKTCVKNNIINSNDDKLIQFTFIKIITRCINKGFKVIYCDECGIMTKNNNYRCYRKPNEQILLILKIQENII